MLIDIDDHMIYSGKKSGTTSFRLEVRLLSCCKRYQAFDCVRASFVFSSHLVNKSFVFRVEFIDNLLKKCPLLAHVVKKPSVKIRLEINEKRQMAGREENAFNGCQILGRGPAETDIKNGVQH
eukprot:Gregarina_sp_Pseudo_9__1477@NODE_1999_length_1210_cov_4156_723313_g1846_i0_p2_GENE_NODE_1999_length_1210_cov_4156_723313_g1846_i0NODE_1999_length_1210_cov_4156_723313_g1846_i0_p2_ORF_typecomplete_len123_score4_09_NODE_1999_length_1210_cov_4156_723313_g1846_i0314682